MRGVKIVTEICDLHSSSEKFTLRSAVASWTEKMLSVNSDLIITISSYLSQVILTHNPKARVLKVPILVDTDFFENTNQHDKANYFFKNPSNDNFFLISYVGGLWKHQGVGFLISAFKKVIADGINAKLLIAGNYSSSPNCDDVQKIAKDLGLEEHIIFPGWVDTSTVKKILDESDLLVISQTNHEFAQAGLPTKLAEYAACAKPILITNVGDVTQYFTNGENCVICLPSDAESMFKGIRYVVENPKTASLIGINAKKVVLENFDYKENGKTILAELSKIIHRN
jgi:glycosyltransferase involved in cell wall biosynthesis